MCIPKDLLFTSEHAWIKVDGDQARVGLTRYAQSDMGDILLIELPEIGKHVEKGDDIGLVETAKAVSDLYSPISGEVLEVNQVILKKPELITRDPYGEGWMIVLRIEPAEDLTYLMDFKAYEQYLKNEGAI